MEKERGKTKFLFETARPYQVSEWGSVRVIKTLQGYWNRAVRWAVVNGLDFQFVDARPQQLLPEPRLDAMFGFRFSQQRITEKALGRNHSGMVGGPTRYGKSTIIRNILRAYEGVPSVLMAPGASLLKQTRDEMREHLPDREVKLIGGGSSVKYQSDDITICSMDSAHKLDPAAIRLLLVDEPHAAMSESRAEDIPGFGLARKIAIGATRTGRYDGRDGLMEGLFGPVLAEITYREAVAEGAICPIHVAMVKIPVAMTPGNREALHKKLIMENPTVNGLCGELSRRIIPREAQTLFFIGQEKHGRALQECTGEEAILIMDKVLSTKERDRLTALVAENEISRVICSNIFVQGVTFHEVRFLVNCAGGGANTTAIQKPGRLAEIRDNKNCGSMIDFLLVPPAKRVGEAVPKGCNGVKGLVRDSNARMAAYKQIGFKVDEVHIDRIEDWVRDNSTYPGGYNPQQITV